MSDVAAKLRLRSAALRAAAKQSYDHKLREVMYQVVSNFDEAADEIERLRRIIYELGGNSRTN